MARIDRESLRWLALEGAAIVASILLAFSIDAWWQSRQDRAQEQVYLAALLLEVDSIIEAVEDTASRNEDLNELARRNIATLRQENGLTASLGKELWHEWGWVIGVAENLDTYEELQSSGGVTIIRDREVRRALASLRRRLDMEHQAWEWTAEMGMQWSPVVFEAVKARDSETLIALEEFLIGWREWNNDEKDFLRQAALEAREAIASALETQ